MAAVRWRTRLGAVAERDLIEILQWTVENFGTRQARRYRDTLLRAIAELSVGPDVPGSKSRDEIRAGVRTLHVARHGRRGRHILVYRVVEERTIEIGRILHEGMDFERQLPPSP